ncbi:MAG: hypothetical protein R3181_11270 [Rubricoccaceae bacterium]|nr:hypothetical protein [Rubricoccaceae bacterium]
MMLSPRLHDVRRGVATLGLLLMALAPATSHAQETEFTLALDVTDTISSNTLTAGADSAATDDFDPGLDVLAPPPPPQGAFDARIRGQNGGSPTDYYTDLRAVRVGDRHVFRISYAPSSMGAPIVISWSQTGFNPGWTYTLVDEVDTPDVEVDLRDATSLDTGLFDETDDPECAPPPDDDPTACIRDGAYLLVDVPPGPVVPDIEPIGAPIVIPPEGGTLSYTTTLTNITGQSETVDAEVVVLLPSGTEFGPIRGPRTLSIPGNGTVGPLTLQERVPGGAAAGTYTVVLRVSQGGGVIDTDAFTLEKEAAPFATSRRPGDPISARGIQPLAGDGFAGPARPSPTASGVLPVALTVQPNPLRSRATLRFSLQDAAEVHLAVHDVLGRTVAVLADGRASAGDHALVFDGGALPSGLYVWRLQAGSSVTTGRLTLQR